MRRCWKSHGRPECQSSGDYKLKDESGKEVPGCTYCFLCAEEIIKEYKEKLGESWTMEKMDQ